MNTNELTPNPIIDTSFDLTGISEKMNLSGVFAMKQNSYLNEFTLFVAHFNVIPNFIHEIDINCRKANNWFEKKYGPAVKARYYNKRYYNGSKTAELDDIFYFLYEDLIVNFDTNNSIVRFLFQKTPSAKVEEIIKSIHRFKVNKKERSNIHLLVRGAFKGIETKPFQIVKPRLKIEDNYNGDFVEIHKTILRRLSKKNDKGLVLLHGQPGTGKTSYIRYLITSLKKDVIFLPLNMAAAITSPDLISILIDHPNSVFVIEDAENIIMDREYDGQSPVSALLNISDGLLADCLNVQVICSFNTDLSKIDKALTRKGRLIAQYEFKALAINKAQQLSDKLGFQTAINHPMTLTEIYNQEEKDFEQSQQKKRRSPIGFRVANNSLVDETKIISA